MLSVGYPRHKLCGVVMNNIERFLERLKAEQRQLILNSAEAAVLPSDNTLRKIADLENSIAAVEVLIQEEKAEKK